MARTWSSAPVLHRKNPLFTLNSRPFFSNNFLHNSNSLSSSIISSPNQLHLLSQSPSSCAPITRVTTAPVEYAPPPPPDVSFQEKIARLKGLRETLSGCRTLAEKLRAIESDSRVKAFLSSWRNEFAGVSLSDYELFLLKCVAAAGQEHVLCEFGRELENGELETRRSSIRSAFYALAVMIENWDGSGGDGSQRWDEERRAALTSLLKMLGKSSSSMIVLVE